MSVEITFEIHLTHVPIPLCSCKKEESHHWELHLHLRLFELKAQWYQSGRKAATDVFNSDVPESTGQEKWQQAEEGLVVNKDEREEMGGMREKAMGEQFALPEGNSL